MKRKYIYITGVALVLFFLLRKEEKLSPSGSTYYNPLKVPYKSREKTS